MPGLLSPSFHQGYALNVATSAYPNSWNRLVGAWSPSMGIQALALRDLSGFGNTGVLNGGIWRIETDSARSRTAYTIKLDGGAEYATITEVPRLKLTNHLTIMGWMTRFDTSYNPLIAKRNPPAANNLQYQLTWMRAADANKIHYNMRVGGALKTLASTASYAQVNTKHHLGATYDGVNMKVYFDGELAGTGAQTGAMDDFSNDIYLGFDGVVEEANAELDDLRIYDRALSDNEMMQAFQIPNTPWILRPNFRAPVLSSGLGAGAEKRFSFINFGDGITLHLLPVAKGGFTLAERQHLLDCYSDIPFAAPVSGTSPARRLLLGVG